MRLFFLMLLLLNGAFFAVNALYEPATDPKPLIINNDFTQLVLLNEKAGTAKIEPVETLKVDPEIKKQKEESDSLDLKTWLAKFTAENPSIDSTVEKIQKKKDEEKELTFCYTAGPFQTKETLQQANLYFSGINIPSQQRSIEENYYIGMLVYLPSQESRQDAVSIAEKLAAQGVKDYMLLNEPGKQHTLSLGVYGLKKNAAKRIKALSKLNYQAKSEARYRKKTVYWLDYAFTASDNQSQPSAQHMSQLNVSQIERNCQS